jgi:hypothetical protein
MRLRGWKVTVTLTGREITLSVLSSTSSDEIGPAQWSTVVAFAQSRRFKVVARFRFSPPARAVQIELPCLRCAVALDLFLQDFKQPHLTFRIVRLALPGQVAQCLAPKVHDTLSEDWYRSPFRGRGDKAVLCGAHV